MTPGFDRDAYVRLVDARLAAFFHVSPAVFFPTQLHQPATIHRGQPALAPVGQARTGGRAMPKR